MPPTIIPQPTAPTGTATGKEEEKKKACIMDHTNDNNNKLLVGAVEALSDMRDMKGLFHQHRHGDPLPSTPILEESSASAALCSFLDITDARRSTT